MVIAVISDSHDHLPRLRAALTRIRAAGASALICCGDLCSPFVVDELAAGFPDGPITIVFGNNDGDRFRITAKALGHPDHRQIAVQGESATLDLGGRRIFVHHFHDVGRLAAAAGAYDVVCYGHNHEFHLERLASGTLVLNPGAVMGWHPTNGDIAATFALLDTERGQARVLDIESGETVAETG